MYAASMRGVAACSFFWLAFGCARIEFAADGGGAPGGGGGSGGSAGGMQAGNGGGGSDPGSEDCTNERDDDDNGLIDCQDPACAASTCVDVPAGWQGPVALAKNRTMQCPAAYDEIAILGVSDLSFDPPSCACSCSAVSGGSCTIASFQLFVDAGCVAPLGIYGVGATCANLDPTQPAAASVLATPTAGNGTCTAIPASNIPEPTSTPQLVCGGAVTGGGCGAGVCAPPADDGRLCVHASGNLSCPAGFPSGLVILEDVVDSRACSACSCASSICDTALTVYSAAGCGSPEGTASSGAGCVSLSSGGAASALAVTLLPGSCPSSGGDPDGTVAGTPRTVCCSPD